MVVPAGEPPPPHLPPPQKVHERRIVLINKENIPTILGLSYVPEPPLELIIRRGTKKKKICCFEIKLTKTMVVYQEPL